MLRQRGAKVWSGLFELGGLSPRSIPWPGVDVEPALQGRE